MGPNRPLEQQPPVSSSEEDEGSESTGSDSDSEAENKNKSPPTPPVAKKPADSTKSETQRVSDDDVEDSGSESESESDSEAPKADSAVKPLASKPMIDTPNSSTKRPRSKSGLPTSPTRAKSKRAKKKIDVLEEEGNSIGKGVGDGQKKQLFQRLWSEDDEIVILKGIMDYVAKKGADPVNDLNAFHDLIKKSLHIDVTKTQLQDKVRRLKKKFVNNAKKGKQGKDRTFLKAHEQKAYDLSKKIWATDGKLLGVDSSKMNGSVKKNLNKKAGTSGAGAGAGASPSVDGVLSPEVAKVEVESKEKSGQLSNPRRNIQYGRSVGDTGLEEEILNDGLELIEGSKRVELEKKWKELRVEQVELYLKRLDLLREQTALFLKALRSGEN